MVLSISAALRSRATATSTLGALLIGAALLANACSAAQSGSRAPASAQDGLAREIPSGRRELAAAASALGCSGLPANLHPAAGCGLLGALSPSTVDAGLHPYALAVSPDGRDVYVGNYGSASVSQFSRNATSGRLSALSPATVAAGDEPHSVAVSGDGRDVYVVNAGSDTITQYARNRHTGTLTALSPPALATGSVPRSIAIAPDGRSAYVANTGDTAGLETVVSQYARNTKTGTLSALSPATVQAGLNPRFVTVSGDGKSVYVASYGSSYLTGFARNPKTGRLSARHDYKTPGNPFSIAVSGDGRNVYAADYSTGEISQFARDTQTGLLVPLRPSAIASGVEPHSVIVSPDGRNVYATDATPAGTLSQYFRSAANGALIAIAAGTIAVGSEPTAIAMSPDGRSAYLTNHRSATVSQFKRAQSKPGGLAGHTSSRPRPPR